MIFARPLCCGFTSLCSSVLLNMLFLMNQIHVFFGHAEVLLLKKKKKTTNKKQRTSGMIILV